MYRFRVLVLVLVVSAFLPREGAAQWAVPAAVKPSAAMLQSTAGITPFQLDSVPPRASSYVGWGAFYGAVVLGAATYAVYMTSDEECLGCSPLIAAPIAIGAGAILGAATGFMVYLARRTEPAN